MSNDTLYRRRVSAGGRVSYEPAAERMDGCALGHGAWLVTAKPGRIAYTRIDEREAADQASQVLARHETAERIAQEVADAMSIRVPAGPTVTHGLAPIEVGRRVAEALMPPGGAE